jgi:hypothetical protein
MSIELDSKPVQYHGSNKKIKMKQPTAPLNTTSYLSAARNDFTTQSTSSFVSGGGGGGSSTGVGSQFTRSVLLSKLAFNLSRGHYSFVCELLRTKSETKQRITLEPDAANEIVTNQKLWLQFETNKLNQKFLQGKTPLILCAYIKETEWALSISRLLIDNGAYMSLKNTANGCGPIHYACALLKPDLVQLFLRHVTTNLQTTRDFNGNTPLVYLLASFYFHFKRVNLVNNMSKSYGKKKQKKKKKGAEQDSSDGRLVTITETEFVSSGSTNDLMMEVNFEHKIEQNNKFFQLKCVEALRAYLEQLRKTGGGVNTANRLGFTVQDFYAQIVSHCAGIENHEFFKTLRNALVNESQMTNLKNSQFFKVCAI